MDLVTRADGRRRFSPGYGLSLGELMSHALYRIGRIIELLPRLLR